MRKGFSHSLCSRYSEWKMSERVTHEKQNELVHQNHPFLWIPLYHTKNSQFFSRSNLKSGFFKVLACILHVETCIKTNLWFYTCPKQMKPYKDMLCESIMLGIFCWCLCSGIVHIVKFQRWSSARSFLFQRPSFQESKIASYSALVLDKNIVAWFFDFQEILPAPSS